MAVKKKVPLFERKKAADNNHGTDHQTKKTATVVVKLMSQRLNAGTGSSRD